MIVFMNIRYYTCKATITIVRPQRRKAFEVDNPVQAAGAARGRNSTFSLSELCSSSTHCGVAGEWRYTSYPELPLRFAQACTGLSICQAYGLSTSKGIISDIHFILNC
jgi:hypothetical protein